MRLPRAPEWGLPVVASLILLLVIWSLARPSGVRARARGELSACKSKLKELGAAMEMYSVDWGGHYPPLGKAQLTPKYLKTIPECPRSGTDTYLFESGLSATYNTQSYQEYYLIRCSGENHLSVSVPADYPQYSGILGLIER